MRNRFKPCLSNSRTSRSSTSSQNINTGGNVSSGNSNENTQLHEPTPRENEGRLSVVLHLRMKFFMHSGENDMDVGMSSVIFNLVWNCTSFEMAFFYDYLLTLASLNNAVFQVSIRVP